MAKLKDNLKTEIKKREYDGKYIVWKQMSVAGYESIEWVVTGVYETRGKAYRASQ
jgi:hypothetical protein